ncbi:DNA-binding HxlR family transcriptional regulator [Streptomyces umbrinus]|uniref:winged helix-turn-helix transcriptional regulator n=1 Tax=Streptomyces phaeochromogenes group TaxID=2838332 RepID=UPI00167CF410|nr:helix-turn-helix domain-containing protein [Streptomyces umbrinus]MCR3731914.1 DNA-binding HxlR family transcriptional regulator [Streptomyces umbrinus]WTA00940.1 helix-turn-helix transcriptional regulator [Streptomyces phaeochromogenes]GHH66431.1 ArsR family transcriptional regulator [Streptomyces umbrinus]
MTLPSTYPNSNCSLAGALEIIGERWTLLIVRDAFYGIRRFGDFATQLGIPRAVLTNRLKLLVQEGVLDRDDAAGTIEYRLTAKGIALWPVVRSVMAWGDAFYSPAGVKRALRHDLDGGLLDQDGRCEKCGSVAPVPDIRIEPGPGFDPAGSTPDPVSAQLNVPRRLLEPLATALTRRDDASKR